MSAKKYQCPYCGAQLTHRESYQHVQYTCPNKPKR